MTSESWSSSAPTGTTLSLLDLLVPASVACRICPETEVLGGLDHLYDTLLNNVYTCSLALKSQNAEI